ncbi:2608_t:CDS:2, partial [Funneliformis caledonium]
LKQAEDDVVTLRESRQKRHYLNQQDLFKSSLADSRQREDEAKKTFKFFSV